MFRLLLLFFLLLVLIPCPAEAEDIDFLTPQYLWDSVYIDSALTYLKMTRADVSFHFDNFAYQNLTITDSLFKNIEPFFSLQDSMIYNLENQMKSIEFYSSLIENVNDSLELYIYEPASEDFISEITETAKKHKQLYNKIFKDLDADEKKFLLEMWTNFIIDSEEETQEETDDSKPELVRIKEAEHEYYKTLLKLIKTADKLKLKNLVYAEILSASFYYYWQNNFEDILKLEKNIYDTDFGKVILSGNEKNNYDSSYLCIIDTAGDDSYNLSRIDTFSFRFIFDLKGDDKYYGSFAGGFLGSDFLYDESGDDFYKGNMVSSGAGFFGIGVLDDLNGEDIYSSDIFSQGAGCFGIGVLSDSGFGNDVYKGANNCQGYGNTKGVGVIQDLSGNETYTIKNAVKDGLRYDKHNQTFGQGMGMGNRPFFGGGIGVLNDFSGNDNYICDIFGQASAYWYSIGILADRSGNDYYNGYQYVQGSGVHFGFAALFDYHGEDYYTANGVSQGCGHDVAAGILFDLQGDDFYSCEGLSQGGGNANAVSILIDANGDDVYASKKYNVQGYSDRRRGFGYIGMFIDINGNDHFSFIDEEKLKLKSTYGIRWIDEHFEVEKISKREPDMKKSDLELSEDTQMLFYQASAAPAKYYHLKKPAIERLVEYGDSALPVIMKNFDTYAPRERHLLIDLLPQMGRTAADSLIDIVQDTSKNKREQIFALYILADFCKKADSIVVQDTSLFIQKLDSEISSERISAVKALGRLKIESVLLKISEKMLYDSNYNVRRESAYALGQIGSDKAFFDLLIALDSPFQDIRYTALSSLKKINIDYEQLVNALLSFPYPARYLAAELIDLEEIDSELLERISEEGDYFLNYFLEKGE